jgi:hypothetical protein
MFDAMSWRFAGTKPRGSARATPTASGSAPYPQS